MDGDYCCRKGYDSAICGHIHVAEMREIDGITYMNDGDWVESCTALAEHHDGRWELLHNQPHPIRRKKPSHKSQLENTQRSVSLKSKFRWSGGA